jgi:hypothetical protein
MVLFLLALLLPVSSEITCSSLQYDVPFIVDSSTNIYYFNTTLQSLPTFIVYQSYYGYLANISLFASSLPKSNATNAEYQGIFRAPTKSFEIWIEQPVTDQALYITLVL